MLSFPKQFAEKENVQSIVMYINGLTLFQKMKKARMKFQSDPFCNQPKN